MAETPWALPLVRPDLAEYLRSYAGEKVGRAGCAAYLLEVRDAEAEREARYRQG